MLHSSSSRAVARYSSASSPVETSRQAISSIGTMLSKDPSAIARKRPVHSTSCTAPDSPISPTICGRLVDVQEIAGVWGVFLWKKTRGQKIKNNSSIRFLPLAKPLLDAGFLDFVEDMNATGHPRLFPLLPMGTKEDGTPNGKGYGVQLSKQFGAYAKTFGIEKGTGFHAFRHTISTTLAEQGVSSPDIALLTGNAIQGPVPTLEKHYIQIAQTATLPKRVKTLAKFKPPLALVKYERGQFAGALSAPSSFHP